MFGFGIEGRGESEGTERSSFRGNEKKSNGRVTAIATLTLSYSLTPFLGTSKGGGKWCVVGDWLSGEEGRFEEHSSTKTETETKNEDVYR